MMKGKLILSTFFLLSIQLVFWACSNQNPASEDNRSKIASRINDSLTINVYYENSVLQAIELINTKSNTKNTIGYHNDGITPTLIGYWKDSEPSGPYYTFFSNGILNCQFSYDRGVYNGNYLCYSENGQIVYKAIYDNGVATSIEVNDTTCLEGEIIMYEE